MNTLGEGRNSHVPVLPRHRACHGQGDSGNEEVPGESSSKRVAQLCLTHGLEWFHWTQRGLLLLAVSSR